jgi:uncharacterized protein YbjQ (UPF0145 family)
MVDLIILATLLTLGYAFGRHFEKQHYKSIIKRETELRHITAIASRIPPAPQLADNPILVTGSVVISVDYFKRFLAALRTLIGGKVVSYESLLDRARREAILRMKEQARSLGASQIFNIKLETASISQNARGNIGSVEVLAYGTALKPIQQQEP